MERRNNNASLNSILRTRPQAYAQIHGNENYADIQGDVRFYNTTYGVIVIADISGLPRKNDCSSPIFAFHIHESGNCTGNMNDMLANVGMHYNPNSCPHPYHAGDLPPLFGANGYAFSAFLTDRFTINEIIGKVVIIHSSPDDFTSQPSGNSGDKIACGVIKIF